MVKAGDDADLFVAGDAFKSSSKESTIFLGRSFMMDMEGRASVSARRRWWGKQRRWR